MKNEIFKQWSKTLFFTIFPFVIPFVFYCPESIINKTGQFIIVALLICIDLYWILRLSKKDAVDLFKYKQNVYSKIQYKIYLRVLNRVSNCEKIKGNFIRDETYKEYYDYKENVLLYNSHRYIERVCEELKSLISEITEIELENVSVSFIYQYPTYEKSALSGWQWITGKNTTTNMGLQEFINQQDTYYHYLIVNNIVTDFENDKSKLIPMHYRPGERDSRHNEMGSMSGFKLAFKNNNTTFCQGYLTVSTMGKKFYSPYYQNKNYSSQEEFREILFDVIIPPFRNLLETELGFLYLRHKQQNLNEEYLEKCKEEKLHEINE